MQSLAEEIDAFASFLDGVKALACRAVHEAAPLLEAAAAKPRWSRRARERLQLLFKVAGTGDRFILAVNVLVVNCSLPLPALYCAEKIFCTCYNMLVVSDMYTLPVRF